MRRRHNSHKRPLRVPLVRRLTMSILAAALLVESGVLVAQGTEEHPGFLSTMGRETFRLFCAACHGPKADGNGSIAQLFIVKPADLTQISSRHGGKFPRELIHQIIEGPEKKRGHGTRQMPIWGEVFQSPLARKTGPPGETSEERAQRKIRELTAYLESIQE